MTREEAIQLIDEIASSYYPCDKKDALEMAIKALELCEDTISRQDALDALHMCLSTNSYDDDVTGDSYICYEEAEYEIEKLPPVQPKIKTEHWIPVKFRPLTDKEQEEYPDYCYMADCPMPDDGEEIFVSTKSGIVEKDECGFDDGYYLDSGYDWQTDIVAWMPLPKPYVPQESEES